MLIKRFIICLMILPFVLSFYTRDKDGTLYLIINDDVEDVEQSEWIGIPEPPFGIDETYRMYDTESNRNESLTYYESPDAGYYTHYIDPCDPNATNTGNTYGTVAKPRLSIPRDLPEGSVVEIHNTANSNGWSQCNISGTGTSEKPIFVRGVDSPHISYSLYFGSPEESHYIILEDIDFKRGYLKDASYETDTENNYLCIRNCDFDGEGSNGTLLGVLSWGSGNSISNVVVYSNTIHDSGVWDPNLAVGDHDYHGIAVNSTVNHLWILNNTMYHCEGDGVQVNGTVEKLHHIYLGGNTAYYNKQSGFWTKTAADVVFSQNTVYGMRHSNSCDGQGIGVQYDCKRVWILFNRLYDNKHGIGIDSQNKGGREDIYFIGNLIYNCLSNGMYLHNQEDMGVFLNTVYNCPTGINHGWYGFSAFLYNNIVVSCSTAIDVKDEHSSWEASEMDYCLLYDYDDIKWDQTYESLVDLIAGTDQGDNCVDSDPLFNDPDNGDFDLDSESPFLDIDLGSRVEDMINEYQNMYGIDLEEDILDFVNNGNQQAP